MSTRRLRAAGVRFAAVLRQQAVLLARDPGPMIGYVVMGVLLITVERPLYANLALFRGGAAGSGIDQACAGASVMFSLFALKVAAAHLLNERTWRTWDRVRSTPLRFGELLAGKALPIYLAVVAQQALLFGFSAAVYGLHPRAGWWALALCALVWAGTVLLLGTGASTLVRSPAQLSAAGDVFAIFTSILGGALVPITVLPAWLRTIAPASPGYWAMSAYRTALSGSAGGLLRPLLVLGAFAVLGATGTAAIGCLHRHAGPRIRRDGHPVPSAAAR